MSCLWLTIEVSPATDILDACNEAIRLANLLGIGIWFDFNGVKCLARPGDDAQRLSSDWDRELKSKYAHKIASDRG